MSGRIKADDIVYVREHAHIDEVVTAAGVALKCDSLKELLPLLWLRRWWRCHRFHDED
jgi:DNA-binding LytR/AlgR family response regulator